MGVYVSAVAIFRVALFAKMTLHAHIVQNSIISVIRIASDVVKPLWVVLRVFHRQFVLCVVVHTKLLVVNALS